MSLNTLTSILKLPSTLGKITQNLPDKISSLSENLKRSTAKIPQQKIEPKNAMEFGISAGQKLAKSKKIEKALSDATIDTIHSPVSIETATSQLKRNFYKRLGEKDPGDISYVQDRNAISRGINRVGLAIQAGGKKLGEALDAVIPKNETEQKFQTLLRESSIDDLMTLEIARNSGMVETKDVPKQFKEFIVDDPRGTIRAKTDVDRMKRLVRDEFSERVGVLAMGATSTPYKFNPKDLLKQGQKGRKFIERLLKSEKINPTVKKELEFSLGYNPLSNKVVAQNAKNLVASNPAKAESFILRAEEHGADTTATAIELIKHYQNAGNFKKAGEIGSYVSKQLTKAGQQVQAAKLLGNMSPESIQVRASRMIEKANKNLGRFKSPIQVPEAFNKKLFDLSNEMQGASGAVKDELAGEIAGMLGTLDRVSVLDKISTAQTISQLLNPKTIGRNIVGNELFYRLERINSYIATGIDWARSKLTGGNRTITFKTPIKGTFWKDWWTGAKAGWKGIPTQVNTQFELPRTQTFRGKYNPLTYLEKAMGASLRSFDHAAYMRGYKNTVGELSYLRGTNAGLKGKGLNEFIKQSARNIDENIHNIANEYGQYITYQDNNVLSTALKGFKKTLNLGKGFGLGDLVLKYPKTPAALVMRAIEYSPAGFAKSLFQLSSAFLKNKPANIREVTQSISRAITGTAGLTGLGYYLADKGILRGERAENRNLAALQSEAGTGPYKVNLSALKRFVESGFDDEATEIREGDTLYSYDWAQPVATSLALGVNMNQNIKAGGIKNALDTQGLAGTLGYGITGGLNTIVEQPVFQGVQRLFGYQDVLAGGAEVLKGLPQSFTPTLLNQIRQMTSNVAYSTYDQNPIKQMTNMVQRRIPGLEKKLQPQINVWGDQRETFQNGTNNLFNVFLNPGFVTKYKETPASEMVFDVFEATGDTSILPKIVGKKYTINGESVQIGPQTMRKMQSYVGTATKNFFTMMAKTPQLQNQPPELTAKQMATVLRAIGEAARVDVLGNRPKSLSKDAIGVMTMMRTVNWDQ